MSQSQRVMRWRLILEEFGPDIQHIKGEDNVVADAISRLPMSELTERDMQPFVLVAAALASREWRFC